MKTDTTLILLLRVPFLMDSFLKIWIRIVVSNIYLSYEVLELLIYWHLFFLRIFTHVSSYF